MPKINVNNVNLFYETFGSGRPLLLIDGYASNRLIWTSIIDELAKKRRVIIFDNRSTGLSDSPDGDYTIKMMADDAAGLLQALKIPKADTLGLSMGGMIAQQLAHDYPNLVNKLIINNSFIKINSLAELFVDFIVDMHTHKVPLATQIKCVLGWGYSASFISKIGIQNLLNTALENPYPTSDQCVKAQGSAILNFDSTAWICKISCPTLIIASEKDLLAGHADAEKMAQLISNAKYHCFQGDVGHMPHIEQTELFIEVLTDFLDKKDA